MALLATPWVPDPSILGGQAIVSVAVVTMLVLATAKYGNHLPKTRRIVTGLAPLLLIGVSAITVGSPVFYLWYGGRSFPDASDFLAGIIYLVFAFAFGLQCFEFLHPRYRLIAWASTLFCGSLLAIQFTASLAAMLSRSWYRFRIWHQLTEPITLAALAVFWLAWIPVLRVLDSRWHERLQRRIHQNCPKCSYNLTGNVSGTCPKCGTPVPGQGKP